MKLHRLAMSAVLFLGLGLVGTAGTDASKKIVGTWEVVKSEGAPPGATVEFTKDGKMKIKAKLGDKELVIDGTYAVKGDKIDVTLSFGGKTQKDSSTIQKLDDKQLILKDDKGKIDEFKRVK